MESKNYICHMPYLRNSIAYDPDIWFHLCKMMTSPGVFFFFFIFSKFWFPELLGGVGESIEYGHDFWFHLSKMVKSSGVFFYFSKILIFWVVRRGKTPKLCPLHFISQEPCIIWSSFMAHLCKKDNIFFCVFCIFSKF